MKVPPVVKHHTFLLATAQFNGYFAVQTLSIFGSLLAFRFTGEAAWAGVPSMLSTLASALIAPQAGRLMDRRGRKPVLLAGQVALGVGSFTAALSIVVESWLLFLGATLVLGVGLGIAALARSAAADMYPPLLRAGGMSVVITGGALGAIGGPLLLGAATTYAETQGWDPFVAGWLLVPLLALLGLALLLRLNPDPRRIAGSLSEYYPGVQLTGDGDPQPPRTRRELFREFPVRVAITTTSIIQAGMVMMMVTAPLSMEQQGHGDAVYSVLTGHYFGMLGLSIFIGRAADRFGRRAVVIAGALVFMAGAVITPVSEHPLLNGIGLFLVGLGWGFCFVAGNALLADVARPNERARLFGTNDLIVGLVSAAASLVGGILLRSGGYFLVGAISLFLAIVPLVLALRLRETRPSR